MERGYLTFGMSDIAPVPPTSDGGARADRDAHHGMIQPASAGHDD
jgi:hypothetical protein